MGSMKVLFVLGGGGRRAVLGSNERILNWHLPNTSSQLAWMLPAEYGLTILPPLRRRLRLERLIWYSTEVYRTHTHIIHKGVAFDAHRFRHGKRVLPATLTCAVPIRYMCQPPRMDTAKPAETAMQNANCRYLTAATRACWRTVELERLTNCFPDTQTCCQQCVAAIQNHRRRIPC